MLAPSLSFGMRTKDCPAMSLARWRASHETQATLGRTDRLDPQRARDRRDGGRLGSPAPRLPEPRASSRSARAWWRTARAPAGILGGPACRPRHMTQEAAATAPADERAGMAAHGCVALARSDAQPGPLASSRCLCIPTPPSCFHAPHRPAFGQVDLQAPAGALLKRSRQKRIPAPRPALAALPRTSQQGESHDMASPSNRRWAFFRGKTA